MKVLTNEEDAFINNDGGRADGTCARAHALLACNSNTVSYDTAASGSMRCDVSQSQWSLGSRSAIFVFYRFVILCLSAAGGSVYPPGGAATASDIVSIPAARSAARAGLSEREVARRIAAHFLGNTSDKGYETDIRLEALMAIDDATADAVYLPPAKDLLRQRGSARRNYWQEPYTSFAFEVFERDGNWDYVEPYILETRRAMSDSLRSYDGVVSIYNDDAVKARPEFLQYIRRDWAPIFVDNVQEYAARMAKAGWLTGDRALYREAADQLLRLRGALRDPKTGLYVHGRGFLGSRETLTAVNWGRGQAWVLRGLVETLSYLPPESSEAQQVHGVLQELGESLLRYQDSQGFWRQVVDRDDSYRETSCTGLISYYFARAVKQGFLAERQYRRASRRAFRALMAQKISADGHVHGGSERTPPLPTMTDYLTRPTPIDDPHGVAGSLFAAAGQLLLEDDRSKPWSPFRAGTR